MKRLLFILSITLGPILLYSFTNQDQHASNTTNYTQNSLVKWMTFEEAVAANAKDKKAGRKPKKIFIDIYTDWCGWCKKMDKETFQQPYIAKYLNQNFYPVKFNAEQRKDIIFQGKTFKFIPNGRRGYHELAAALLDGKMSYPTVVFLNEEIQLLQRIPGFLNVSTFETILHYLAEDHYKTTPWSNFEQEYVRQKQANE